MLDAVTNFGVVEVAQGYSSGATSIGLSSGDASKLPVPSNDGEYNVVWWDSTNYSSPPEDPNVEIVRVTANDTGTDTLTVERGKENTSASSKDTSGATYKMYLTPTAKTIQDIEANLTTSSVDKQAGGSITAPKPVVLSTGGVLYKADANYSKSSKFIGFLTSDLSSAPRRKKKKTENDSSDLDINLNAPSGNSRYVIAAYVGTYNMDTPSKPDWGNTTMTEVVAQVTNDGVIGLWYLDIGDAASGTTKTISWSHSTSGFPGLHAACYEDVKSIAGTASDSASGAASTSLSHARGGNMAFAAVSNDGGTNMPAWMSNFMSTESSKSYQGIIGSEKSATYEVSSRKSGSYGSGIGVIEMEGGTTQKSLKLGGVVSGFSGLTPSEIYYLQDGGGIGTSPGSNSVVVGKAISSTELLMVQN